MIEIIINYNKSLKKIKSWRKFRTKNLKGQRAKCEIEDNEEYDKSSKILFDLI